MVPSATSSKCSHSHPRATAISTHWSTPGGWSGRRRCAKKVLQGVLGYDILDVTTPALPDLYPNFLVGSQAEVTIANESRGFCIGDLTTLDQDECETMVQIGEWRKNKTLTSTWVLFFLQAINYPILWLTLTAVENSFLRAYHGTRFSASEDTCPKAQLCDYSTTHLLSNVCYILAEIAACLLCSLVCRSEIHCVDDPTHDGHISRLVASFPSALYRKQEFQPCLCFNANSVPRRVHCHATRSEWMRTRQECAISIICNYPSVGQSHSVLAAHEYACGLNVHCIICTSQGYTFAAFKRDEPTKAFCLEMREDVRGMRFLQETQREELKQGYMNNRKMFGASRSGPNEADLVGSPV